MHHVVNHRILPVLAGAAVVVVGVNVASYAANGHALTLGAKNTATRTTTVATTGKGAALSLQSRAKSPSLAVSSSQLVTRLNADRIDGKHATDLQTQATTWTIPAGTDLGFTLKGLKPGSYLATVDVALADAGPSQCELDRNGTAAATFFGANRDGAFSVVSGSALIVATAGDTVQLSCDADEVVGNPASSVTLVRLDRVTIGSVTVDPSGRR